MSAKGDEEVSVLLNICVKSKLQKRQKKNIKTANNKIKLSL